MIPLGTPYPVSGTANNTVPVAVTPPAGNLMTYVKIQNLSSTDDLYISYESTPSTYETIEPLGIHTHQGTIAFFWILGGAASVSYRGIVNVVRV
jgi:hypothetical protein